MADRPALQLTCDFNAEDHIRLGAGDHRDGPVITIHVVQDGEKCNVLLHKDKARELFNWLGVWLHT